MCTSLEVISLDQDGVLVSIVRRVCTLQADESMPGRKLCIQSEQNSTVFSRQAYTGTKVSTIGISIASACSEMSHAGIIRTSSNYETTGLFWQG